MSRDEARARRGSSRKRPRDPLPSGAIASRPVVAIVGRPNVGKSTLFNRLAGAHIAIVEDVPGVTRDRHYADALALGKPYVLVDTGGFDPSSDDPMAESIAEVGRAVDTAVEAAVESAVETEIESAVTALIGL